MKTFVLLKPELEERRFGSSFDPLLNGVAHGLAALFPPVENARRRERREEGGRAHPTPASAAEDDRRSEG